MTKVCIAKRAQKWKFLLIFFKNSGSKFRKFFLRKFWKGKNFFDGAPSWQMSSAMFTFYLQKNLQ